MIDSITIRLELDSIEIKSVLKHLKNQKDRVLLETGEISTTAFLRDSLQVRLNGIYLTIKGSLSQFYNGQFYSLGFNEIKLAIDELNSELGIDARRGKITRLDLEATFPLEHPIKSYFEYLGESSYLNRFIEKNTLYYSNDSRKVCFYDKGKKIRRDAGSKACSENLIRFEARFFNRYLRQLEKKYNLKQINLRLLESSTFQNIILSEWFEEYNKITKHSKLHLDLEGINGLKDFKEKAQVQGVESLGGVSAVLKMLNRSRITNSKMDSSTLSRIKSYLKKLESSPFVKAKSNHLLELNVLIAASYLKNLLSINESN